MVKEDFIKASSSPHSGLVDMRDDLLKVTAEYPWFSIGHILLCKADHNQSHIDLDKHLQKAAVYASSRSALYAFLTKERLEEHVRSFEKEIGEVHETYEVETEIEPEESKLEEVPVVDLIPEEQEIVVDAPEFIAEADVIAPVDKTSEIEPVELLPIKKASDFDDLQREILLEAISSTIEIEAGEVEEIEEEEAQSTKRTEPITAPQTLSAYATWLKSRAAGSAFEKEIAPVELPSDPKKKQQALIDRFIKISPKITPGKADQFRSDDIARLSLVEDETFVTETMAKIYAEQGQFAKAIKAYNVLSLKFPEKSVYFANQIKKLQERRKSTK
ncbi:MAG: hypothetical protein GC193_05695 [Cryomorphaceae bacterium]|nr:hypothetical protein [Cryomorphaceae bacterium]